MDANALVGELISERCRCGRLKAEGKTVCTQCWHRLPRDAKRALYRRLGDGYEEAYAEAVKILDGGKA